MLSEYWKRFFEETGEIRPPREGEWFCNLTMGLPVKAEFDFTEASFPIIKQKLVEEAKMTLDEEKRKEFREVVKPLIKFLNDNCHPHVSVIVDCRTAELFEGICHIIVEDYLRD